MNQSVLPTDQVPPQGVWAWVTVLDPYYLGREIRMQLLVIPSQLPKIDTAAGRPPNSPFPANVLQSPVQMRDKNAPIHRIVTFEAIYAYYEQYVSVIFGKRQWEAIFSEDNPNYKAEPPQAEKERQVHYRFKCWVRDCNKNSSALALLHAHVDEAHPGHPFDMREVIIYEQGREYKNCLTRPLFRQSLNLGIHINTPTRAGSTANWDRKGNLLFCLCLEPDDHRPKIECSNADRCERRYFHLECVGLINGTLPRDDEAWYCPLCYADAVTPTSATSFGGNPVLTYVTAPDRLHTLPYSADQAKTFMEDLVDGDDSYMGTLDQAKETLRVGASIPLGIPVTPSRNPQTTLVGTTHKPNPRTWTPFEEQKLVEAAEATYARGLRGEPFWAECHKLLLANGVSRAYGGMKMLWNRRLRDRSGIDERRKPNRERRMTSVQTPKAGRYLESLVKGDFYSKDKSGQGTFITHSAIAGDIAITDAPELRLPLSSMPNLPPTGFDNLAAVMELDEYAIEALLNASQIKETDSMNPRKRKRSDST